MTFLSRPVMDELQKQDKFVPGSVGNIAGTPVALAVRRGATRPDISTVDALKHTLLYAKSIVYADPSKGGASGVYFARVIDRLGIADQLKSKTILVSGAQAAEIVAKGEAEIGVGRARRSYQSRAQSCWVRCRENLPAPQSSRPGSVILVKSSRRQSCSSNFLADLSPGRC